MQMLIVLLLIGLPVALFLAWAYELTPDGVVKAEDVPEDAPKDPRSGQRLNRITLVALIVAVAWIGWDAAQDGATRSRLNPWPLQTSPSLYCPSLTSARMVIRPGLRMG